MNVVHYQPANWEDETDNHCIVGYHPRSDQIEYTLAVPKSKKSLLSKFVRFGADDPDGYDSYKLSCLKVSELARLLGRGKPPEQLKYFIEYRVPEKQKIR